MGALKKHKKVVLDLLVHQYSSDCGRTFSEIFDFVAPNKFIALFERHRTNILNYFKTRLLSGAVEGAIMSLERFIYFFMKSINDKFTFIHYKDIGLP